MTIFSSRYNFVVVNFTLSFFGKKLSTTWTLKIVYNPLHSVDNFYQYFTGKVWNCQIIQNNLNCVNCGNFLTILNCRKIWKYSDNSNNSDSFENGTSLRSIYIFWKIFIRWIFISFQKIQKVFSTLKRWCFRALKHEWKLNEGKVRNSKTPTGDAPQDFFEFSKNFFNSKFWKIKKFD